MNDQQSAFLLKSRRLYSKLTRFVVVRKFSYRASAYSLITLLALIVTAIIAAIILLVVGVLQSNGTIQPDINWTLHPTVFGDAITFVALFAIISLVSLLSNREVNKSLKRARKYEQTFLKERDNLEERVVERTIQLEALQKERLSQLQRFADFGRISAGLVHDIANPLTAVSLRLEQINNTTSSRLISEAIKAMKILERYIEGTRRQLQSRSEHESFELGNEISQVIDVISYKAHMENVSVKSNVRSNVQLHGDPCRFSQAIANLVVNAIEAYMNAPLRGKRLVLISANAGASETVLVVQDWGVGIRGAEIVKIFEPFYGNAGPGGRGFGIGLSMVKQIVEEDFGGSISVSSSKGDGTRFVLRLPTERKQTIALAN